MVDELFERYIHGYCDPWSAEAGETVKFMVSAQGEDEYEAVLVKFTGDPKGRIAPGVGETVVSSEIELVHRGRFQNTLAGSCVIVGEVGARFSEETEDGLTLTGYVMPTTASKGEQGILTKWVALDRRGYGIFLDHGHLEWRLGDGNGPEVSVRTKESLLDGVWYAFAASYQRQSGHINLFCAPVGNRVNGRLTRPETTIGGQPDYSERSVPAMLRLDSQAPFVMAGFAAENDSKSTVLRGYNGKLDRPRMFARGCSRAELLGIVDAVHYRTETVAEWDFSVEISRNGVGSDSVTDLTGRFPGRCFNMPARGMTGHNWHGREEDFTRAPNEYGAVHFHDDDLEDAEWEPDFELRVGSSLESGAYAVRLRGKQYGSEEYVPFFVRPPRGERAQDVLLIMPTATYMAYGNWRLAEGVDDENVRMSVVEWSDVFLWGHDEYGLSTYDVHSDGSGVCYSSRLRPMLNIRPKHESFLGSNEYPADLCLVGWLNAMGHHFDVITDEELHREGVERLRSYRVVVTGCHPEYYSSEMLDALFDYVEASGRLMYMGGNGFYWVMSYHPSKSHVIEVRKAESGTRSWQANPGEYHHSTTGERGGLWRNRGRPPQKLVGVGFGAQGFDTSASYQRMPDSYDPRVAFIFEGISENEELGNFGFRFNGGGAAGVELDRYDSLLGSPPSALLLASSHGHSDRYQHAVEEITQMVPGLGGTEDGAVRGDMVFFRSPGGGAVFSTGSIAYSGSLSYNGFDNNISRLTNNVLKGFLEEELPGW